MISYRVLTRMNVPCKIVRVGMCVLGTLIGPPIYGSVWNAYAQEATPRSEATRGERVAEQRSISGELSVTALRTEDVDNPIGIDIRLPRLSWQITSSERNTMQSAYQIRVAATALALQTGEGLLWDSRKVTSHESTGHVFGATALQSAHRYYWTVRVWDNRGGISRWSPVAFWEMGLLASQDWKAQWIRPIEDPSRPDAAPMLRKAFQLRRSVSNARLYVTSHGLYEIYLNGRRVGDQLFTPGWTSYNKRLQYQTYDVTSQLNEGRNAIGII